MEEIIIEETNYKVLALALANLFLLLASIAMIILGFKQYKVQYWALGTVASIVFLIGLIGAIIKEENPKKLLTITMDGITDNSSLTGVGFLSFDDIKEFQTVTLYNKKAIAVIPKNMDSFLSKLTMAKRMQVKRNIKMNLPPVAVYVDMAKDMEPEDILSLLQKRFSDYSSLYE